MTFDATAEHGGALMVRTAGWSRRVRVLAGCVLVGALLASCSDDASQGSATTADATTTTTTATTVATSGVCADRDALKSAVESLKDVNVRQEGTNGVNAALDQVTGELDALQESASAEIQPQVTALKDAVAELKTTAADLGDSPSVASIADTAVAVRVVSSAATSLVDSLKSARCG